MLASSLPLLDVVLSMVWFFLFFLWVWMLISILSAILRSNETSGIRKALWVLLIVVLPFVGALVYLITRRGGTAVSSVGSGSAEAAGSTEQPPLAERRRG